MRKLTVLTGLAFSFAAAAWLTGCMSMDEMLASEDGFWRDIGETQAVSFALDGANPLEKRLEVVPKIANQQKLAKIVIDRNVAPEVKAEARKRIDETTALVAIALNAPDRNDQMDALKQIEKSEDARVDAAWLFAEAKPSSQAPKTLLKNLSDAGMARFAKSYVERIDAAVAAGEEAARLKEKFGDSMASGKLKEQEAILNSLVSLAPCVEDENTITTVLNRQDIADVRGSQYDFLAALQGAYSQAVARRKSREAEAFLATLTDDELVKILEEGRLTKQGKTIVAKAAEEAAAASGSSGKSDAGARKMEDMKMMKQRMARAAEGDKASATPSDDTYEIAREVVLKAIKDQSLVTKMNAAEAERKAREEERRQRELALKALHGKAYDDLIKANIIKEHDINHVNTDYDNRTAETKYKAAAEYIGKISYYEGTGGIKKWMQSIELFKDSPDLQQEWTEMVFEHAYRGFDDEKKLAELKKVMAVMPQSRLVEIFRSNITDTSVNLKARAVAYGITDQALLKNLLVDDDSWARPRRKNCDKDRRRIVHDTLLDNVKNPELADKIFCETRPTKNTDVITVGNILCLVDRISEAKRKELTDRAIARSEEAAKTTVTVLQYYVGMSYLDYKLINFSNGNISSMRLSKFDDNVSRKMTSIAFTKENRIKKLDITENNVISACYQFGTKYGHVPDGKDVSGKTDVVCAIRTTTAYSDSAPAGVSRSNNSVWKWIDYVHDIQAEIGTNSGNLVLRAAEIEGEFNDKDLRQEQQAAVVDAWADIASGSDDEDMGPDEGLEPVGL